MAGEADGPIRQLLVGDTRQVTAAALVGALALFGLASAVEYMALANVVAASETNPYVDVRPAFGLAPLPSRHGWVWVPGYLLAGTLSAGHAYLNRGYLPSLVLALAPSSGIALWTSYGMDDDVGLAPGAVYETVLVEGLVVATVAFLVGVGLRHVRRPEQLLRRPNETGDR